MNAPFVFDDYPAITDNASIRSLSPVWGEAGKSLLRPPHDIPTSGRPLVNISFALNYAAGGLEPYGYHVINMAMHVISTTLLFALVRRTLELPYFGHRFAGTSGAVAAATALVWAVHPLLVDAVEYITQRTELMVGFCYLATLYASLRYFASPAGARRGVWLATATIACFFGMASKEVMVTAPVVVWLYERTFIAGSFRKALRNSWPLYLAMAASWLLLLALNVGGPRSPSAGFGIGVPAYVWWMTQCKVLFLYLKLTVCPYPLVIHYEASYIDTLSTALPWIAAAAMLCIAIAILMLRRSAIGFLGAAALLVLSPTLVVPIIFETVAERRMYLPLAALVALFVAGGYALIDRISDLSAKATRQQIVTGISCIALLLIVICAVISADRVGTFESAISLWRDNKRRQPHDALGINNLGVALFDAGLLDDARAQHVAALKKKPDYADAHFNLGTTLVAMGRHAEAISHLEQATRSPLKYKDAQINWGIALVNLDRPAEAVPHFDEGLRDHPNAVGYAVLATAYGELGRRDEAIATAKRALEMARAAQNADLTLRVEKWLADYMNSSETP